jgi:hypothetical protein
MKLLGVILASAVAQKNLRKQKPKKQDRTGSHYMDQPPTEQCLSSGKHAVTGQLDFGEEQGYGYSLSYQASGWSGYIDIQNYHDYMNCYIDIIADPTCEEIEINYTSAFLEKCSDCHCDTLWISYNNENNRYENQCGCIGDACVHDFYPGEYDGEYEYDYSDYDYYAWKDSSQDVAGNKFRFNMQSDGSVRNGDIRVEWRCTNTQPESTNSCSNLESHDQFKTQIHSALSAAVDNDSENLKSKEVGRFKRWLQQSFDKLHMSVSKATPRTCLRGKFTPDSPGNLSKEILGSDCGLDIELGDIHNACSKLQSYFAWAYEDCTFSKGYGRPHKAKSGRGALARLEHRCNKINQIRSK